MCVIMFFVRFMYILHVASLGKFLARLLSSDRGICCGGSIFVLIVFVCIPFVN